jgi:hypothetical protein
VSDELGVAARHECVCGSRVILCMSVGMRYVRIVRES